MKNFIISLKQMSFMNFHKDKKNIPLQINTHDIKDNKQLSEMFQPFYDYKAEKGSMKSFFYHNRYEFEDFPDHLNKFQIYDPDCRVDSMIQYRKTILNKPIDLQVSRKRFLGYDEEIDDFYPSIYSFEIQKKEELEKLQKSSKMEEKPKQVEKTSEFKIRRKIGSFTLSKDKSSGNKIKLSKRSEVMANQVGNNSQVNQQDNLAFDLLKSQYDKNLTFRQRTVTEDFLQELQNKINYSNSNSIIPLIEMNERRYFELYQMKDPKSLILYKINEEGHIDDCQKLSNLDEFNLPSILKNRPFYLYLFYHAFLLFENNWSFIYNLLLKNPIFENVKIDFSNIISGINLTKFLLGEQFYETTKRPLSNSLTKQLFKILRKSSQLSLEYNTRFPKDLKRVRELDHFDSIESFYSDLKRADFNRDKYIEQFCKIEEDIKDPLGLQKPNNAQTDDFPTPFIKKNKIKIESESNIKSSISEFKNQFELTKTNDKKFKLFCETIKRSDRVEYQSYLKNSKKQLFCYKLKKFKGYRDKKLGKIKSLAKKYKLKNGKKVNI